MNEYTDETKQIEPDDFNILEESEKFNEEIVRKQTSYWKDVWRNFYKRKTAIIGFVVILILILLVIFGPLVKNADYISNDYTSLNTSPSTEHWFGTDALGRDMWARVWVGGRISLLIAVLATIFPYVIGMLIGGSSGYIGGKFDMIIMRSIDILMGIPSLIYMILLMMVFGSGSIITLILAMSITGWMEAARMTRGLVLQMRHKEFILASETVGVSGPKILIKHLLPNTLGIIIVSITMSIPRTIYYEAFLSFIGLGVTPPQPSWGQLIKSAAETFRYYPFQFLIPCACVSITMLCFNLIGDGLRDALDPKLRS